MTTQDWVLLYLKGISMGAADIVPGVSGGTIALIIGIYDRLINALAAFDPRRLGALRQPFDPTARRAVVAVLIDMDVPFLIVLGTGVGTAVILGAEIITTVLAVAPGPTYALFTGLIGASGLLIGRRVSWTTLRALAAIGSAVSVAGLSIVALGIETHALWIVFLAGMISVSAMVLPGISGAVLLLILGQYEYLLGELQALIDGLLGVTTGTPADIITPGIVVVTFLLGAILGVLSVARLVSQAFKRDQETTVAVLVGLLLGGITRPVQETAAYTASNQTLLIAVLAAGLGIGVIVLLDRYTGELAYV